MKRSFTTSLLALLLTLLCSGVLAQSDVSAPALDTERNRIASERSAVESKYRAEEKTCYLRFSVTDCLKDARARRRTSLADLHRQDLSLGDAQRKLKAAEHLKKIEEKAAENQDQEAQKRARAINEQRIREEKAEKKAETASDSRVTAQSRVQARLGKEQSAADKATSRAAKAASMPSAVSNRAQKTREAAEHRERLEKKERERTKPAARPLPLPPGAS